MSEGTFACQEKGFTRSRGAAETRHAMHLRNARLPKVVMADRGAAQRRRAVGHPCPRCSWVTGTRLRFAKARPLMTGPFWRVNVSAAPRPPRDKLKCPHLRR